MRIDLSDLDRLTGFTEALERLFWCLVAVAFFAAILGSAGTGLLVLILGAAAFVLRAALEDFVRSRREPAAPADPEFTVYRASRRPRRTKSAV
jgi:hypothetical protein